jgi:hypothetical protein
MKNNGYIAISRSIFDHPVFSRNRLTRIGAYTWLCANQPVNQSVRELARNWEMSKTATARCLDAFAAAGLIRRYIYSIIVMPADEIKPIIPTGESFEALRFRVFERDKYQCVYCGGTTDDLQCDHIKPSSRGGPTILENLATACGRCNQSKGRLTPSEWQQTDV